MKRIIDAVVLCWMCPLCGVFQKSLPSSNSFTVTVTDYLFVLIFIYEVVRNIFLKGPID